jgi:Tfp pilus assembly protein PilZ
MAMDTYYESDKRAMIVSGGNLNIRGMFLPTSVPDNVGLKATIRLLLPGETRMLKLSSRVVWNNDDAEAGPTGMGLCFEDLLPWQIKRIAAHLLREGGWNAFPPNASLTATFELRL